MPWELYIHHIDVGQGESTLIVARNPGLPVQQRSMLIDGGLAEYGETVHNYITANLHGFQNLDRIVTSHYDKDHSGGVVELLIADNRYRLCQIIAAAAGNAAAAAAATPANNLIENQIGAAAAAALVACRGGYNNPPHDYSIEAVNAGVEGQAAVVVGAGNAAAAQSGLDEGNNYIDDAMGIDLNPSIITSTVKLNQTVRAAGIAAGTAGGTAANRTAVAYAAIENALRTTTSENSRFRTNGIYRNTNVIDVGDLVQTAEISYRNAVRGTLTMSENYSVNVPGINRLRTTPDLGDEILWNTGPNAQAAPAGAPAVYVVAVNREVRNAPIDMVPIVGDPTNNVSIGLVVRFNDFFYYTGGDLPWQGEDLVVDDVLAEGFDNPLPPPATFAAPNHICCFKCGHHGSQTSNSQYFINNLHARAAFISSGSNDSYEHPDQPVIDRLHANADIQLFYLTNCNYPRTHVPGYDHTVNQLTSPGNKSRISGDNNQDNLAVGRNRGNIVVYVDQNDSTSLLHPPAPLLPGQVYHRFRVRFWDEPPVGVGALLITTHDH